MFYLKLWQHQLLLLHFQLPSIELIKIVLFSARARVFYSPLQAGARARERLYKVSIEEAEASIDYNNLIFTCSTPFLGCACFIRKEERRRQTSVTSFNALHYVTSWKFACVSHTQIYLFLTREISFRFRNKQTQCELEQTFNRLIF